jgi:hypothetical protein
MYGSCRIIPRRSHGLGLGPIQISIRLVLCILGKDQWSNIFGSDTAAENARGAFDLLLEVYAASSLMYEDHRFP